MTDQSETCRAEEKILYVDDDDQIIRMMKQIFEIIRCPAEFFTNPREAIKAYEENPDDFDLVITDFGLKHEIDGEELIKTIRGTTRKDMKEVEIILLTGESVETIRDKIDVRGVTVLQKPINQAELRREIRATLDRAKSGEAS